MRMVKVVELSLSRRLTARLVLLSPRVMVESRLVGDLEEDDLLIKRLVLEYMLSYAS